MINYIQTHIMQIGIPLAIVAGLGALLKILPSLLEKKAIAALDYLFEHGDAADDRWLCATIAWAEEKYGAGTGAIKAKAVVDKIVRFLPVQYRVFMSNMARSRAIELFQACFDRLEAVALKEVKNHENKI